MKNSTTDSGKSWAPRAFIAAFGNTTVYISTTPLLFTTEFFVFGPA